MITLLLLWIGFDKAPKLVITKKPLLVMVCALTAAATETCPGMELSALDSKFIGTQNTRTCKCVVLKTTENSRSRKGAMDSPLSRFNICVVSLRPKDYLLQSDITRLIFPHFFNIAVENISPVNAIPSANACRVPPLHLTLR